MNKITAQWFNAPSKIAWVIFSPTTDPIEPPMNEKAMTATIAASPSMVQLPIVTASVSADFFWLSFNFSS